jgi:hypothetical protein
MHLAEQDHGERRVRPDNHQKNRGMVEVSRDMKCCDSCPFKSSHLPSVSHFMTTPKLRRLVAVRHEMRDKVQCNVAGTFHGRRRGTLLDRRGHGMASTELTSSAAF